ncbi:MAG: hypothetical protein ACK5X3_20665, partial [Pseudomonadota bacterium]
MTKHLHSTIALIPFLVLGGITTAGAQETQRWKPDTNGDAMLSQAEFVAAAERRFARVDTNGDGIIDKAEIEAAANAAATRARLRIERQM